MSAARITVCIPTYNRAHYLRQALHSLCSQGLNHDEYVVAISDNCSSDQTQDVVAEYRDRLQITYHRNTENVGARANWEIVTALCDTPYIVWLPDDDLLSPGQLGCALSAFDAHEGAVLVCSPAVIQEYPGDPKSYVHGAFLRANVQTPYNKPYIWDTTEWLALALVGMPLSILGAVFHYDAYRRCELWKPYWVWADRLMLAEMALHGNVLSLPWVGGYYRVGHQSRIQLGETNEHDFGLVTRDLLDLCNREKIPVVEFWVEQIRLSPLKQRAHYLHLLKRALPSPIYEDVQQGSKMKLKTKLMMKTLMVDRSIRSLGALLARRILKD